MPPPATTHPHADRVVDRPPSGDHRGDGRRREPLCLGGGAAALRCVHPAPPSNDRFSVVGRGRVAGAKPSPWPPSPPPAPVGASAGGGGEPGARHDGGGPGWRRSAAGGGASGRRRVADGPRRARARRRRCRGGLQFRTADERFGRGGTGGQAGGGREAEEGRGSPFPPGDHCQRRGRRQRREPENRDAPETRLLKIHHVSRHPDFGWINSHLGSQVSRRRRSPRHAERAPPPPGAAAGWHGGGAAPAAGGGAPLRGRSVWPLGCSGGCSPRLPAARYGRGNQEGGGRGDAPRAPRCAHQGGGVGPRQVRARSPGRARPGGVLRGCVVGASRVGASRTRVRAPRPVPCTPGRQPRRTCAGALVCGRGG